MKIYDIKATTIEGDSIELSKYRGKVLLIVNTASKCGFTPQFKGLEWLFEKHNSSGLEILGFPCNQFKEQDPGSNDEIKNFCLLNYGVSFQMFEKIDVNGENRHPLYDHLINGAEERKGSDIAWNFEKFLVDRNGNIIKRYNSIKKPEKIEKDILKLL